MKCRHCDEDVDPSDLLHKLSCCGQQGAVEAEEPLAPYAPFENVRASDPDTSRAAAASLDVTVVQARVYKIHMEHKFRGLTDEELLGIYVRYYGPTAESSPRKRRCDLTKAGLIVDSGQRRMLKSGRMGIVWLVAETAHATGLEVAS
jgi:hypothetical protein